ncbi:pilin [Limosilactobacillus reuteri]|uniref:pilin n=1 Tax=Limosilactobacillus reuteri TaxID=1598 RepID=UPI001C3F98C3|nr:pilin [Limosilactobacillus reuteri]
MQIISDALLLIVFFSLIAAIIYGIRWFRNRKNKESKEYKKNKRFTIVSLIVLFSAVWFVGSVEDYIDQHSQQTTQTEKKITTNNSQTEYLENKEDFIRVFTSLGIKTEDLSKAEGNEWRDAIRNEGENFNASTSVKKIEDNHRSEIIKVKELSDQLHQLDQKIQQNDYPSKADKETIHEAYLNLKHFATHATDLGGSFETYVQEHNDLDRKMGDSAEALKDL